MTIAKYEVGVWGGSGSFRPFYLFALGRFALQVGRFAPQGESFRPSLYFSKYSTII